MAVNVNATYVDVRKELDKDVSFADMAKIVGERWQALEGGIRQSYETEAIATKTKYQEQLAEYKKTAQYRDYQAYLADFKAKSRPHATGMHLPFIRITTAAD